MIDPAFVEFAQGVLGGLLTLPLYALLWPLLLIVTHQLGHLIGYVGLLDTFRVLMILPFYVAVMGIPMYLAGWLLSHWSLPEMPLHSHIVAGRTYSAKSLVYFLGWLLGFGVACCLSDRLPPLRHLSQAWSRWVDRLPG